MGTLVVPMEELVKVLRLQLDSDGKASLTVTGNSMYPMLKDRRDKVVLVRPEDTPKNRDLILYRRDNGAYVLHRIVRVTGLGEYLCVGDNQWETEAVKATQVVGVVESFVRKGKQYSVTHNIYRINVWVWTMLLPIRRPLLRIRRFLGKIRVKLKKRK